MVGEGIIPRAATGSAALDKKIDAAFLRWCAECDAAGTLDFYGLQAQVAGAEYESGEVFVRFRNRRAADGLSIPLQLQVLEADFCDITRQAWGTTSAGSYTLQGIEFDQIGSRIGYWLFSQHPGEMIVLPKQALVSNLVPASEVLHVFWPDRPGQVRGVTNFAAVMMTLNDLGEYEQAEIVRKKIEACLAAFVTQNEGAAGPTLGTTKIDGKGNRIESFDPGMVGYLQPGEDVKFNQPAAAGGYEGYKRARLRDVAAGLDVMYEQISGDLSQVNYSSYRAGAMEFRQAVRAYRKRVLIPQYCTPIWRRFIDTAFVAGLIPKQNYGVRWSSPGFESVDPKKEAEADTLQIRAGTKTLPQVIAESGADPVQHMQEISKSNALIDQLNLVLDSDPRKSAKAGGPVPNMDNAQGGSTGSEGGASNA